VPVIGPRELNHGKTGVIGCISRTGDKNDTACVFTHPPITVFFLDFLSMI